jgi:serine/threonine protein kinase
MIGSLKWAADQGNSYGLTNYGVCLEYGLGIAKNLSGAVKYYKLSADQGNPIGQCNYAMCTASGIGDLKDVGKAATYFQLSVKCGYSRAQAKLDHFTALWERTDPAKSLLSDWIKDFHNMTEIRVLGKGRFGIVKLVEDPTTKTQIAVKYFNKPDDIDLDHDAMFLREVELLVRLQHPCILQIIGYSLSNRKGRAQIGMKFAVNGSLRSVLNPTPRPSFMNGTGIAIILYGVAYGMAFLHSKGAIHRDLKPENILLDECGWPKIGDFGSGKFVDLKLTQTTMVGDWLYMAPEMYYSNEYTTAVDVFSYGLIVYELVVGYPVFSPDDPPMVLMRKVTSGVRGEIPKAVSVVSKKLIERCWAADPNNRPSFDKILVTLDKAQFGVALGVDPAKVRDYATDISQASPTTN